MGGQELRGRAGKRAPITLNKMPRAFLAGALTAIAIIAAILWGSGRVRQPFIPVLAMLLLLVAASLFGKTNRFADRLRPLVGSKLRALVWGAELPATAGASFSLDRVLALGAGLHLYLSPLPSRLVYPPEDRAAGGRRA